MADPFVGWQGCLSSLPRISEALTRSISAENPTGGKGSGGKATEGTGAQFGRALGQGWKVSPCINLRAMSRVTLADIEGPGAIRHIWMTVDPSTWRRLILRFSWDGEETPSVEAPLGDFFCNGWCVPARIGSLPVAVNSKGGLNSYWVMPFQKHATLAIENVGAAEVEGFFYQIDYSLEEVPREYACFHAQWRRVNPLPYGQVHTVLDNVSGRGLYVGTYIAWRPSLPGWWGEGEVKFYLDGDGEWPTICGTGTEDYFGGAWCFEETQGEYGVYSTPFLGLPQAIKADNVGQNRPRFGMYRWHIPDPIRFQRDIRVSIQALGWDPSAAEDHPHYMPLRDDIASTAFWYQTEPHVRFPPTPKADVMDPA